jgi:multidrug efflux pump subunit AcrB
MRIPIQWMARNHVAANLLMTILVVGGILVGFSVKQEVFPGIDLDIITVTVPYPGAGPEEVEEGVLLKLEENLSGVNGVKEVRSSASEGVGVVTVEVLSGEDIKEVLEDVKTEVDRISTFPDEAEAPVVKRVAVKSEVISVVAYGDVSERALREYAEEIQDELLALKGVTQVDLKGVRPFEISIEIPESTLNKYALTLDTVAARVRTASLNLPAGFIKTDGGVVLLRSKETRYRGVEYADIVVIEKPDGSVVRLGQIATIKDTFAETDVYGTFDGQPGAMVTVFRVGDQKPVELADTVKAYVAQKAQMLPDSVRIATWNDQSELFKGRKELLMRNAFLGLILVLLTLGLFLEVRLSLWVMLGLPISFLGAIMLMPAMDVSINMISMFAFILVLGIVVDDAIVVGESIYEHRRLGKPYLKAAVDGTVEVAGPVVFSVLSTIAAFLPLMFVDGMMGKIMEVIPLIVIPVLAVSLIECLFILPAHLSIGEVKKDKKHGKRAVFRKWREGFNARLVNFVKGPYTKLLTLCLNYKAIALATAFSILFLSIGLVGGGIIKFRFMPEVEGDIVLATVQMPIGTTLEETGRVQQHIVKRGLQTIEALEAQEGGDVLKNIFSLVGMTFGGSHPNAPAGVSSSHLSSMIMYLVPGEDRKVTTTEIAKRWKDSIGEIPGVENLIFKSNLLDLGANTNVRLAHKDFGILDAAADQLKTTLAQYPGVVNIDDSYSQGKRELNLSIKPEARTLGLTEAALARQVRSAFYGSEALRVQRGRNEVKVMVRYPKADRNTIASFENMYIRSAQGSVPLSAAAQITEGRGFSTISRTDRKRVVSVTADVDASLANAEEINSELKKLIVPALIEQYPGLSVEFEGEDKERQESMQSMLKGFLFALLMIYALLAIPFGSYSQPLVIMAAIPFGIVGGIFGHWLMGYNLSILSLFGIVALSGVVVNDSLLFIDHINRKRKEGMELFESIIVSGQRRFRPILLTSLTTFFGLAPMLAEQSLQAKFLIPMAISLAFGVLFATFITLLLIPTLYFTLESLKAFLGFRAQGIIDSPEESAEG